MPTIAHISDLHFGTEDPAVAQGLLDDLAQLQPTLVVNSGDLTQRARVGQFLAARAFLARIPFAQLTVPGNHRSEEHTPELQSHSDLVCRLLLEKKKITVTISGTHTGIAG